MVTEAEARRLRPFKSGVVALAVSLVATMVWYYLGRPDESARPVRSVEWASWVKAGEADGQLRIYAPEKLPLGWRATSARYVAGNFPLFEIGMLTDDRRFVGVVESKDEISALVEQNVDEDAERGEDVTIGGTVWQVWTDSGGDYALALAGPARMTGATESLVVYGSAPDDEIRDFAASLRPRG